MITDVSYLNNTMSMFGLCVALYSVKAISATRVSASRDVISSYLLSSTEALGFIKFPKSNCLRESSVTYNSDGNQLIILLLKVGYKIIKTSPEFIILTQLRFRKIYNKRK